MKLTKSRLKQLINEVLEEQSQPREPSNDFKNLRSLSPEEFLKITASDLGVFRHQGSQTMGFANNAHWHAYVIIGGQKVIAPEVIPTGQIPMAISAQGDSDSEALLALWKSIKAAKPKALELTKAAAKPQPQTTKQTTGRRDKINITNKQIGDFIVATAEYPMRGRQRKQYAQAKIINGNLEAASKKATEEVRKRVEAMLASEPSNTQDQAALKKNIKSSTIGKFLKNGPPDSPHGRNIKDAFKKPAPQAAAAQAAQSGEQDDDVEAAIERTKAAAARYQASQLAAKTSSAGEFDGLGTRSILRKKFPNEPIRKAFEKLKQLSFNDPARVAYRKAFKERNLR